MKKPFYAAMLLALAFSLAVPGVLAAEESKPLSLKQPLFYQYNDGLKASVTVCNNTNEDARFTLQAENLAILQLYRRNLKVGAAGCETYDLALPMSFSRMSKAGDEVKVSLRRTEGLKTASPYRRPDAEVTAIVAKKSQNQASESYQDFKGGDALYGICKGLFIEHSSGMRLKIVDISSTHFQVAYEGAKWGSSEILRLFPGKTKTLLPAKGGRLNLTNEGGSLSIQFVR